MPAHDSMHEVIARPFSNERSEGDDEVAIVPVTEEGEAPDAGQVVLASRAALAEHRVEASAERTESVGVEVEAADLAAERVDIRARLLPRGEREAFHRVQIDVEAREAGIDGVVQLADADDADA